VLTVITGILYLRALNIADEQRQIAEVQKQRVQEQAIEQLVRDVEANAVTNSLVLRLKELQPLFHNKIAPIR
jgi:hypothetical protein